MDENQESIADINNINEEDTATKVEKLQRRQMGIRRTESGSYECDVCFENFPSHPEVMHHHNTEHTFKKYFPCSECGEIFKDKTRWCNHNIVMHDKIRKSSIKHGLQMGICATKSGTFKCDVCLEDFPTYKDARHHHTLEHKNKKHFPCPECGKIFTKKEMWRAHNKKVHKKFGIRFLKKKRSTPRYGICATESGTYKCDVCLKDFPTHKEVTQHHSSEHTLKKYFPCQECGHVSLSKERWFSHNKAIHDNVDSDQLSCSTFVCDRNSGIYRCNVCFDKFPSKKEVMHHHKSEHTSKAHFPCQKCDQVFSTKNGWLYHNEAIHTKVNTRKLLYSYYVFDRNSSLYQCNVCLDKFSSLKDVTHHHRKEHTIKKHFPCTECDKVLISSASWRAHRSKNCDKFPKRARRVKCKFCGDVYLAGLTYKAHVKKCKKVYIFHCKKCSKFFRRSDALQCPHDPIEDSSEDEPNECDEVFGSDKAREKPEECHKDPNNQCYVCHKWFLSPEACESHRRSHDPNATTSKEQFTWETKKSSLVSIHNSEVVC